MNRPAQLAWLILTLLTLEGSLKAQARNPSLQRIDPLIVAANLARDIEGTPGSNDQELTLDECLRRTFAENPDIQQEKIRIEIALGQKLVFRSRAFPDIRAGLLAGQQGPRGQNEGQEFALLSGSFKQPLFEASIPAAFRRGNIGIVVAQQTFQSRVVEILHKARLHYYSALFERGTLAILDQVEKPLMENVKMEKDRVTAGLGVRSSVIQAEIRRLQLVPLREAAKRRYRESLSSLALDMGSNLKEPAAVQLWPKGPLPYMPTTFNLQSATEEALENRPDILLAQSLIRQTFEDRRIVQGGYYPQINLAATGQYLPQSILADENSLRPGQDTRNTEILVGPVYTWKVIDTGRVAGAALSLEKVKEGYEIQLANLEQNVPKDLSEIYRAIALSQQRISSLAGSVNLAEENLRSVQDMISMNKASQLDFVNARNALLQTKQGMLNAFYQNSIALANLDLATGRYLRYVYSEDRKN